MSRMHERSLPRIETANPLNLPTPINRRDEKVWRRVYREDAVRSQGGKCCYCGERLSLETVTADHIVPIKSGGRTERTNIAAACRGCNGAKKSMPANRFKRWLRNPPRDASIAVWLASFRFRIWARVAEAENRIATFAGITRRQQNEQR